MNLPPRHVEYATRDYHEGNYTAAIAAALIDIAESLAWIAHDEYPLNESATRIAHLLDWVTNGDHGNPEADHAHIRVIDIDRV